MRGELIATLAKAENEHAAPVAYAAGHDHSLQVFRSNIGPPFVLVSGLGSSAKSSVVGDNRQTLFAHSNGDHPGFMLVDFLDDDRVRLSVIEYAGKDLPPNEVYSTFLDTPRTNAGG